MANVLKLEKQVAVISALVEGASVRSVERITGVHRDTILRLMVRVANVAAAYSDRTLRDLDCKRIEVDEIWAYVARKQRNVSPLDLDRPVVGDQYTFVALDADTKLIPCWRVGKRTADTTWDFISDLKARLRNRVQLTSDGFEPYFKAIDAAFGGQVDYARVVKTYSEEPAGRGRYSPPKVVDVEKDDLIGFPDLALASTSYVERQNLTIRMQCRRLTRLTNGFSKKLDNLKAALDLHFTHYNFVRTHKTLRCTPAMEAGVASTALTVKDLVGMAA
jgi:IS1 family transposase